MNVEQSVIAITGAGGGLGAAMAQRFASLGARLALLDFRPEMLEELASGLDADKQDILVVPCDVSKEAEVDEAFAKVAEHFGRLDVLVNNAGITRDALTLKFRDGELVSRMSLEHWQAVIDVNLTGVFLCGRAAAEQMVRAGNGGLIVNISSVSRAGNVGQANYSATKAGVAAMTVTWSKEFARYGIRVNTISPGFIGTDILNAMKPEALAKLTAMIPAGRIGDPDEIAHTVQYLVENDYVNGRNIEVDGALRL
jgi:3-oxoacyl-[acyl-carrier protein] reductase